MKKYNITSDLIKGINFIPESQQVNIEVDKGITSDLAKIQLIRELSKQRDSFLEIINNKIEEIESSLINTYSEPGIKIENEDDLVKKCDYEKEVVILKDPEKLSLLKNIIGKSIAKITFYDGEFDYTYLDAFLDEIDEDGDDDDLDDYPLLYLLPNFVMSEGGTVEIFEESPLEVYLDEIKEIIIDGIKYKFVV